MKTHNIESDLLQRTGKYAVYGRVSAFFSPEMLETGAVKAGVRVWETPAWIRHTETDCAGARRHRQQE